MGRTGIGRPVVRLLQCRLAVFGCQDLSLRLKRLIIRNVRTTALMMEGCMGPNLSPMQCGVN
jgi:hypothetical protein